MHKKINFIRQLLDFIQDNDEVEEVQQILDDQSFYGEPSDQELEDIEKEVTKDKFMTIVHCDDKNDMNIYVTWDRENQTDTLADELGLFLYLVSSGHFKQQFINILHSELESNGEFAVKVGAAWEKHKGEFEKLPVVSSKDVFNRGL